MRISLLKCGSRPKASAYTQPTVHQSFLVLLIIDVLPWRRTRGSLRSSSCLGRRNCSLCLATFALAILRSATTVIVEIIFMLLTLSFIICVLKRK